VDRRFTRRQTEPSRCNAPRMTPPPAAAVDPEDGPAPPEGLQAGGLRAKDCHVRCASSLWAIGALTPPPAAAPSLKPAMSSSAASRARSAASRLAALPLEDGSETLDARRASRVPRCTLQGTDRRNGVLEG
jgi:hypothetical protein